MTEYRGKWEKELRGITASPGIVIGKAHLVYRPKVKILYQYLVNDNELNKEIERFKAALRATEEQLIDLKHRMPDQVKEHAFILDSHLMILADTMFSDATIKQIVEEKINAEWALKKSVEKIGQIFKQIDDEYIRSRIDDVENVAERVLRNLSGDANESVVKTNERIIVVAHDLSPTDTTELDTSKVMGFLTDLGGRTSHAAIMAQALHIPLVVGLESVTTQVKDGDLLIVDGNTGEVIVNPDDNAIIYYQEKQLRHEEYESTITRKSHLPAITLDGHKIRVKANIEFLEQVVAAKDNGAEGIGLYRTEFPFLKDECLPTEEELFEDYREVAEIMSPDRVTIRTVDLGADKFTSDTKTGGETNPALGMRAIRFCLKEPEVFKKQLRAILRASIYGNVELMFPMISGLQEILDAKEILEEVKKELASKNIDYANDIKVGIMIEIPSAVTLADVFAQHVDFFSIGTNDLIQYALAIDRINEHVAHLYEPFHPAILRMIQQVVNAAKKAGIGVYLCGEMAGDPICASILLCLGIEELSMNARAIPVIKNTIRSLSIEDTRVDLTKIFEFETAKEVRAYIENRLKGLSAQMAQNGHLAA